MITVCHCFRFTHPHVELHVLVGDCFHVEADGGDRVDGLPELQLVEDGRLAGGVQPQHQDPHLLVAEHLRQNLPHPGSPLLTAL